METTIFKKVKGETMTDIFNFSKICNVRYYKALDLKEVKDYNAEKVYKFEINVRHPEGTDATFLINSAIKQAESK